MEVTSVIIKPPSMVARIEGKANKAILEKIKENLQADREKAEQESASQKAQDAIDLLV